MVCSTGLVETGSIVVSLESVESGPQSLDLLLEPGVQLQQLGALLF
jgi:hypothetical protein